MGADERRTRFRGSTAAVVAPHAPRVPLRGPHDGGREGPVSFISSFFFLWYLFCLDVAGLRQPDPGGYAPRSCTLLVPFGFPDLYFFSVSSHPCMTHAPEKPPRTARCQQQRPLPIPCPYSPSARTCCTHRTVHQRPAQKAPAATCQPVTRRIGPAAHCRPRSAARHVARQRDGGAGGDARNAQRPARGIP